MNTDKHLYFIAIIPPDPLRRELTQLKEYMKDKYHSKAALKSPPHITLHMPFKMKESKESVLFDSLSELMLKPFDVRLSNFNCFPPRVIYIDVENNDTMYNNWKEIVSRMRLLGHQNNSYKDRGFTPHLTIAFRDLKKSEFLKVWEEFKPKEYQADFHVKSVYVLKHDGQKWNIFREILFKS